MPSGLERQRRSGTVQDLRQRRLRRLGAEVRQLREVLGRVRAETRHLLATNQRRPLTDAEDARVRALQQEGERLWWDLQRLREDFAVLQAQRHQHA